MKPTLYAFVSVKGGVGKSSLAIAAAVGLARAGRAVAVVDCDLTGTSLADGLPLQAPGVDGLLSYEETRARRRLGGAATEGALPFFDHYLFTRTRFDPPRAAWRHPQLPEISWFPSSPAPADANRAARALVLQPDRIVRSLRSRLAAIGRALGPSGVILVDLPPSLFGVTTAVVQALAEGRTSAGTLVPVLVSTPDRNDLYRSADEYLTIRLRFGRARWLLNRNRDPVESVRSAALDHLSPEWRLSRITDDLVAVGFHEDTLGRLFVTGSLALGPVADRVVALLARR